MRVARSLDVLLGEINRSASLRSREHDGPSDIRSAERAPCICHKCLCSREFTHDPVGGFDAHDFADWLALRLKNGQEGRVKNIISSGRICSGPKQPYRPGIWREYKGKDPHEKHVHVSVEHPSGVFDHPDSWQWEEYAQRAQ